MQRDCLRAVFRQRVSEAIPDVPPFSFLQGLLIFGFLIMLGGTAAAPYIYSLFQVLRWRTPGVMAVVSSERPHFVLFSRMSRALPF